MGGWPRMGVLTISRLGVLTIACRGLVSSNRAIRNDADPI